VAMTRMAVLVALVGSLVVAHARPSLAATLQGTIVEQSFDSAAGPLSYDVYLPPGYATSGLDYPVIYYLHGLPAHASSFRTFGYVPQALERAGLRAIVVAPQGATDTDTDPEYLDWGPGRDWESALAVQLPHLIDASFRTIAGRDGRALVGVSAGGYGATMFGLHHLVQFSVIEAWSGYFHPTDKSGVNSISPRPWYSAHSFVPSLKRAFAVNPTFFAFYVGESDGLFRPENIELARQLSRAGVAFMFRIYPGGHQQSLWTAQASLWLGLALAHLAAPAAP
jgi:S-formylglutathione hydrolase FrmB